MPFWKTEMKELAPGVFAYVQADGTWFVSNAGLIIGKEDAIVIDSLSNEKRVRVFMEEIAKTTDKPVRLLINTHSHGDHIWTNHFFKEAKVICHERCREATLAAAEVDPATYEEIFPGLTLDGAQITPQDITFEKELTLYTDDLRVQMIYNGPAHTTEDIFIYLEEAGIVFCGDLLFYLCTPLALMGHISGWIATLDLLAGLGAEIYVPGHGPVTNKNGLLESREYLLHIQNETKKRFDAGMDPFLAAKDIDLGEFAKWKNPERIVANVERLYSEFRGEEPGVPLDVMSILPKMMKL